MPRAVNLYFIRPFKAVVLLTVLLIIGKLLLHPVANFSWSALLIPAGIFAGAVISLFLLIYILTWFNTGTTEV